MSQTEVLLREIKAPRAVLKFEGALPGPVMLHDGLYRMHSSLFNGFLLADADSHAIGQFLTQKLSQLIDHNSVLSWMTCSFRIIGDGRFEIVKLQKQGVRCNLLTPSLHGPEKINK